MVDHVPVVIVVLERGQSGGTLQFAVFMLNEYCVSEHLLLLLLLLQYLLLLLLVLMHSDMAHQLVFVVFHGGRSGGRCLGGHESTVVVRVLRLDETGESVAQHAVKVERGRWLVGRIVYAQPGFRSV